MDTPRPQEKTAAKMRLAALRAFLDEAIPSRAQAVRRAVSGAPLPFAAACAVLAAAGAYALFTLVPLTGIDRHKRAIASAVSAADRRLSAPAANPGREPSSGDAGNPSAVSPLDREKEKEARALSRKKVKEAETLYRQAVKACERGDGARARELYGRSLEALGRAPLAAGALYRMKDDFSLLFYNLDRACAEPARDGGDKAVRPIPLDRENELVQKYLKIYTRGRPRGKVLQALERSGRYRAMILPILKEYDLPEELVYLPLLESFYDENDLSSAGALGLWQLMPDRARALGLKVNFWIDERKDPEKSTRAAARYLRQLFIMFDDWHLALAAYNRGENGLARDLAFTSATNIEEMRARRAVPRETRNYVPQFIVCVLIGQNPEKYGFRPVYEKPLEFDEVTVNVDVDLKIAAQCAGTDLKTVRKLNPALQAWCTPLNYPGFTLRLPPGTKESFAVAAAREKDLNPQQRYVKYRVQKGDSLGRIAKKFHTTRDAIREDNPVLGSRGFKPNQVLVIRPGEQYFQSAG